MGLGRRWKAGDRCGVMAALLAMLLRPRPAPT